MNSFYKNTSQMRNTTQSTFAHTKMNQRTRVELFNQLTQGNLLEQKKQAVQQISEKIKCLEAFAAEQKRMNSQHLQYLQIEIIALQQNQKDILNAQNIAIMQSILIRLPSNQQFIVLNKKGQEVRVETKYFLNYITNNDELNSYLNSLQTVQPYGDEYSVYFNDKHRDVKNIFDKQRLDDSIRQNAEQITKLNDRLGGNFQTTNSMTDDPSSIFEQSRCQSGLHYNKNQAQKYQNVQSRYLNYSKPQQKQQQTQQPKKTQKTPAASNQQKETSKQKLYMNPIQQMMRNKQQKQQAQQQQAENKQKQVTKQEQVKNQTIQQKPQLPKEQKKQQAPVEQPKQEQLPTKNTIINSVKENVEIDMPVQKISEPEFLQIEEPKPVAIINDNVNLNLQPNPLDNAKYGENYDDLFEALQTVEQKKEEVPNINIELQTNFAALAEEQRRKVQKKDEDVIELSESSNDFDDPSEKQSTNINENNKFLENNNSMEHVEIQEDKEKQPEIKEEEQEDNIEVKQQQQYEIINNNIIDEQQDYENPFVVQNDIPIQESNINVDQNGFTEIENPYVIPQVVDNQSQTKESVQSNEKFGFDNDNLFDNDQNDANGFDQPYSGYQVINNQFNDGTANQEQKQDENQYEFEFNF